jgi:predicted ATPase
MLNAIAKKIVLTGGPSTGKTTLIQNLSQQGYVCYPEISREVTAKAQLEGVEQLFLENPDLFNQQIFDARIKQFESAALESNPQIFIDRGLPDVMGYMLYLDKKFPEEYYQVCLEKRYDYVFILPPWKAIHTNDSIRYETFEEATKIHEKLNNIYSDLGYKAIQVPTGTVAERTDFILQIIKD